MLKKAWTTAPRFPRQRKRPLPNDQALEELLATTYHTSLLKEEGRKLEFRVVAFPKSEAERDVPRGFQQQRLAIFSEPRAFSVAELGRLAPAAESRRSMICVDWDRENGWRIWGLLDTGANWWEFTRHESSSGSPPPSFLTVSSANAGEIVVSTGGDVLLTLRSGLVYVPQSYLLFDGLVSDYLEPVRRALYRDCLKAVAAKKWDPEGSDNNFPKRFFNFCLSRILTGIRDKGHGGTVLLIPDELAATDARLTDRVTIKYPCKYSYAWELMVKHLEIHRRFYDLHFPLWDAKQPIDAEAYKKISMLESERARVDEALSDCFRFIGSLAGVDGALVLSHRLSVVGFGAEVIALSPTMKQVQLATDARARKTRPVSIEAYGTRHRSAFRFCSSYEDSVAFIISQDGGIKAAKRAGANVYLWPDVNMASLGI